jgi:uncharacterized protein with ACT and thioredoxin-like domain
MANEKTWIITIGGDRPIQDIAEELANAGLKNVQILQQIGSITGSADEEDVRKMRKIHGVVDISPERRIDIGPPGSSFTW